ncbi:ubiquitin carboxyl-terminal hydrolase 37-like [Polyodon spathula]|uniref:ubiquitin carboxyl-terminal hydrolase 37-like n=1 Tax=Polyodon spathula TaxID=7913 RepID=UPI001B7E0E46|nr:ubiquitin carboxyl-terminal hydrolase 37-like [Polyodon spathula]
MYCCLSCRNEVKISHSDTKGDQCTTAMDFSSTSSKKARAHSEVIPLSRVEGSSFFDRNEVKISHSDTKGDQCTTAMDFSSTSSKKARAHSGVIPLSRVEGSFFFDRLLHTKSTAYDNSAIIFCNLTEVPPLELRGLYNLGFTCYMNATLQCLFSVQTFYTDLLRQNSLLRRMPQSGLLRCFTALMSSKNQCRGEAKKLLQQKVKDALSASAVMFSGNSEQDAHEFLNHCLDQLKEDGEKLVFAGEVLQATSPGISLSKYSCPVVTNMDFQLQYKMTCTGCGDFSVRRELFTMLSISVLPGCSIQDCLDHFFKGSYPPPQEVQL